MNDGWIKLHRKMKEWEWYDDSNTVHLFLHLLLSANHETKIWHGVEITAGQLLTGRKSLSKILGMGEQSVRTSLTRLKSTSEITIKSTNKYSIITIQKWKDYQVPTSKLTNDQPATNQQLTTNKNDKKEKNILSSLSEPTKSMEYTSSGEPITGDSEQSLRRQKADPVLRAEAETLLDAYNKGFREFIKDKQLFFRKDAYLKLVYPPLRHFGLPRMLELLAMYFRSRDKIYLENKWSISCFLSDKTLNKLHLND